MGKLLITIYILSSFMLFGEDSLKFEAKVNRDKKLVILVKKADEVEKEIKISNEIDDETLQKIKEKSKELNKISNKEDKKNKDKKINRDIKV